VSIKDGDVTRIVIFLTLVLCLAEDQSASFQVTKKIKTRQLTWDLSVGVHRKVHGKFK
jgi:hypothetical protein